MTSLFIVLVILAEITGLAGVSFITAWMVKFHKGFGWDGFDSEFNVHPLMMTVGMMFINGNALMLYRVTLSLNLPRIIVKIGHLGLQVMSTICGCVGLAAVFQYHNNIGVANMYSFHSWVGLATFIMFGLQLILGFTFFIIFFFFIPRSENLRGRFLPLHVFFGKMILVLATVTTCIGIQEKAMFALSDSYQNLPTEAYLANFGGLSFLVFTVTVMYILSNDDFKKTDPASQHLLADLNRTERT